jgi:LysM repeat protein
MNSWYIPFIPAILNIKSGIFFVVSSLRIRIAGPVMLLKNSFIFFVLILFSFPVVSAPFDSLRVEKEGKKNYIIHKVDPKETVYSLAKRYNVTVALLTSSNPELKEGLKIGQLLRIPFEKQAGSKQNAQPEKTHTVAASQTLYSIARMYSISVEDIKKWNTLSGNELSLGQVLYVSEPKKSLVREEIVTPETETIDSAVFRPNYRLDAKGNKIHKVMAGQTLYGVSKIYKKKIEDLVRWNNLGTQDLSPNQEIIVEKVIDNVPPMEQDYTIDPNRKDTSKTTIPVNSEPKNFNKVIERGIAEVIEETNENPKFLALHKTAPVGTIIQVTNETNNQYVFVRVIGKLPNTGANDKVVIKISKKAFAKLGSTEKRFPVELSYVP